MEDKPGKQKKPLSSASEIMHRHDRKKRKWFRNILHGEKKSSEEIEPPRVKKPDVTDKIVSRSLENIGHFNLSVLGLPNKAASLSQLKDEDDDDMSCTSVSSTDSDVIGPTTDPSLYDRSPQRVRILRQASTYSSDSESSVELNYNPVWQDYSDEQPQKLVTSSNVQDRKNYAHQSGEYKFSSLLQSYLPFSWRNSHSRGSTDSVISQSEENQALMQLVNQSDSDQEAPPISNRHALMQYPFHQLEVWLQEGRDLVVRDSCVLDTHICIVGKHVDQDERAPVGTLSSWTTLFALPQHQEGTSDPYVKFKIGNKQLYKSRIVPKNLCPKWDERFILSIEDVFRPILVKVYDYDRGSSDDSMGSAELVVSDLVPNTPTDLELQLAEKGKTGYMGYIKLQVTLVPKTQEDRDQYLKRTVKITDKESAARKLKMQMWTSVVTVVLVEGRELMPMDDNGLSDPYVKFKLGNEKYKSKHKPKTLNPTWLEQFDLRMYPEQTNHLEIVLYDHDLCKDDFMGRAVIDLSKLEREKTHTIDQQLEDGAGTIKLLITISGSSGHETISDLSSYTFNPEERAEIIRKYGMFNSFKSFKDVGWLQVKVYKAQNLMAADIGGKSDPFVVLELVNTRLQTHTEYKTINPEWNKVFSFNVKDIHSVLEVTVYDEDRDKKVEFLGKVAIPLLRIHSGEKRWFALKDKKLIHRTRGSILLELDFIFNHIKAAVRTVNPKEEKYMQPEPKFKISVMKRNIDRVSTLISAFLETGRFISSCYNWDSPVRSITAFAVFLVIVWNFELYMLPLTLVLLLLKNVLVSSIVSSYGKDPDVKEYDDDDDDFDDEEDKEKEEKKSFKEKLHAVQEICLQVQEGLDVIASLGESIKNTFLWSVPWLTSLAVIVLSVASMILYYIPVRYLVLAWGINKFTKKLRAPNAIPNNELLDFLSRVPSDRELVHYRELRPDINTISSRKKTK